MTRFAIVPPWLLNNRIPIVLVILHLGLALWYGALIPIFEASDENNHFFFARQLALTGHIPDVRSEEGPWMQQATQGPLYYLTAALPIRLVDTRDAETLMAHTNPFANLSDGSQPGNKNAWIHDPDREAWPWRGSVLAVHLGRLVSALYGALTVWFTYWFVRNIAPQVAGAAAAFVALLPQFVWGSGSMTNDTAIAAMSAMVFWALTSLSHSTSRRMPIVLGVLLGLATLAKTPGLILSVYVVAVVIVISIREGWRAVGLRAGPGLVMGGVVAGPWLFMNWVRYGDPTGLSAHLTRIGGSEIHFFNVGTFRSFVQSGWIRTIPGYTASAFTSLWGVFGLHNILAPAHIYEGLNWLALLGFVGFGLALVWPAEQIRPRHRTWFLVALGWFALHMLSVVYWAQRSGGGPGRLLFPALPVIAFLCAMGWRRLSLWLPRPLGGTARAWPLAIQGVFAVTAPAWLILPTYRPPAVVEALPPSATALSLRYGELELVGIESQNRVEPGQRLAVTYYWRLAHATTDDYAIFPRLLDGQLVPMGGTNSYPGWGNWPVALWTPGVIYKDRYELQVEPEAQRPSLGRMILAVEVNHVLQKILAADDNEFDPIWPLAEIALPPEPAGDDETQIAWAGFGRSVILMAAEFPETARAGDTVHIQLVWRSEQAVSESWQRFVHLDDGNRAHPRVFAQYDSLPANGYGLPWWTPGESVPDTVLLAVPADLSSGNYALWLGLTYPGGQRVAIEGGEAQDGRLYLGTITVP